MDDLISRQEAIYAVNTALFPKINTAKDAEKALRNLPPAQPDSKETSSTHKALDTISRKAAIDAVENIDCSDGVGISALKCEAVDDGVTAIKALPSAQPEKVDTPTVDTPNCDDTISRQAAIEETWKEPSYTDPLNVLTELRDRIKDLPSAQPEQRYTEEELRVFAHGISLSLLSKRSAQHWRYDEDTATEIKFLERLYDKVVADMGDEQDG